MATKTLTTRIKNKYDIEASWMNSNIILMKGELALVVDSLENPTKLRIKCGDGVNLFENLPYVTDAIIDEAKDIEKLKALIKTMVDEAFDERFQDGLLLNCGGADPTVNVDGLFDENDIATAVENKLNQILNASY